MAATGPARRHRWLLRGLLAGCLLLVVLAALGALGAFLIGRDDPSRPSSVSTQVPAECSQPAMVVQTGTALLTLPVTLAPGVPTAAAPSVPAGRPIQSLAFLDLPFPYDGGNENFGGSLAQFKRASQRSASSGRINSFFDHLYPLYPAPQDPGATVGGREPAGEPIGRHVLIFDGTLSNYDNYSGHPAYDFSTFVRRQATTPVFAAADGVVFSAGTHSASGALFVKIKHTVPEVGDFVTTYWHLHPDQYFNAMLGRISQPITAGTRVGTMGNTGWSTGHHLHFEVRFDRNQDGRFTADETVDPYGFIPSVTYASDPWAQSVSFTDALGRPYSHAPSISDYLWIHPLGVTAEVPQGGGQVQQPSGDGIGGAVGDNTLCAEPGSLPPGGNVNWSWAPDPPPTANLAGSGNGCALSAFDAQGEVVARFDPPLRIEISLRDAELEDLDAATLAIYWLDGGSTEWRRLPTRLDFDGGIAAAFTDRPGHCALLGVPTRDLVAPTTRIDVSGATSPDGSWYESVVVNLSSTDPSGISGSEYSLDGGATWLEYSGPFTLQAGEVPEPPAQEAEEVFGGGPGRFLILAASRDNAGNFEEPPAYRSFVIDPSKGPATPSATSTATSSASVTFSPSSTATATPSSTATATPTTGRTAPDTTPPPAPTLISPPSGAALGFLTFAIVTSTVTLEWASVSDPSGIANYEWVLQGSSAGCAGPFDEPVAAGATFDLFSDTVSVFNGKGYRWRVRAEDGAGNVGPYSAYSFFAVGTSC